MKGEVDFLPVDKRQIFPQIDTNILGVNTSHGKVKQMLILHKVFTTSQKRTER